MSRKLYIKSNVFNAENNAMLSPVAEQIGKTYLKFLIFRISTSIRL